MTTKPDFHDLWRTAPNAALARTLEVALKGDLDAVWSSFEAWPDPPPWGLTLTRTATITVVGFGTSTCTTAARNMSLFDAAAAALEVDLDETPGPPTDAEMRRTDSMAKGSSNGVVAVRRAGWTAQRDAFFQKVLDWTARQPQDQDPVVTPLQRLLDALVWRTRWDEPVSQMLHSHADTLLVHAGEIRDVPSRLFQQGRMPLLRQVLQAVPPENQAGPFLVGLLQELTNGNLGADSAHEKLWKQAWEEVRDFTAEHMHGQVPVGPRQQAALDDLKLLADKAQDSQGLVVMSLRWWLKKALDERVLWPQGMVQALVAMEDERLRCGPGECWQTGKQEFGGRLVNAKIEPLLDLAVQSCCEPVLRRLADKVADKLDTCTLNPLWKPKERFIAFDKERFVQCNQLLLQLGLDLDVLRPDDLNPRQDFTGDLLRSYAPLHLVAVSGQPWSIEAMMALMELGADPRTLDHSQRDSVELFKTLQSDEAAENWASVVRSWLARRSALEAVQALDLDALRP